MHYEHEFFILFYFEQLNIIAKTQSQVQDASGFETRITTGPKNLKQKMPEEKGREHSMAQSTHT
jgi:hypothetical protein